MVAARTRVFRVLWSDDILDECVRNLIKDGRATKENMERMVTTMKRLHPDATVTGYHHLISSMTCDEKDKHVLAAAVVGKADVIVTYNIGDFPQASVEPHAIEIQTPDEFIHHVLDLAPAAFIKVFCDNAALRHKPPVTPEDVANHLESGLLPISGAYISELLK
ncbi:MAG: PIN domain-containing protein [Candidatus Melainabacteria bacterium]|nr:MAG: PIN domain-containing protein [Candidatus Melainabacteria bacterium]